MVTHKFNTKAALSENNIFSWRDFKVKNEVGEGNFARVYKASSPKINVDIALRVLKVSEAAAMNRKKIQREARQLIELDHDHIVRCYGLIIDKLAFVLEYCETIWLIDGSSVLIHSLLGLLNTLEEDLPVAVRLNAVSDIASGLTYLHQKKLIAGDLKPNNILISSNNTRYVFKLSDLSFCQSEKLCSLMSTSYNLAQKEMVFTLLYIASELVKSDFSIQAKQNSATDIFSLAIVIYQVLFPEVSLASFISPVQHLEAIRNMWRPEIPQIQSEKVSITIYKPMIEIMVKCWNEIPIKRPTALEVFTAVKQIEAAKTTDVIWRNQKL